MWEVIGEVRGEMSDFCVGEDWNQLCEDWNQFSVKLIVGLNWGAVNEVSLIGKCVGECDGLSRKCG